MTPELVEVDNERSYVKVQFTPTIPNCSMATLIGLMIRTKLNRELPPRYKVIFINKAMFELFEGYALKVHLIHSGAMIS